MFGVDWSNPQTIWLNVTNLFLGIVTLLAVAGVGFACLWEVAQRRSKKHASQDSHAWFDPELGLTMADGGEPVKPGDQPRK